MTLHQLPCCLHVYALWGLGNTTNTQADKPLYATVYYTGCGSGYLAVTCLLLENV